MIYVWGGILVSLLTCSCVTTNYTSKGQIPVHLNLKENHKRKVEISHKKTFYLWGLYPNEHIIELDKEFVHTGARAVSGLQILEKQTFTDSLLSFISLGIVIPRTYIVDGYSP